MKYSLKPVIDQNSKVLILGTMPGDESLRLGQYYANPRNQFWTILSRIYEEPVGENYCTKLAFLQQKGLALWDVLRQANREGSLDRHIKDPVPNDIHMLFHSYPSLRLIAFNGSKAEKLFYRWIFIDLDCEYQRAMKFIRLPSTSPVPGKYNPSLEDKIERWKIIKTF